MTRADEVERAARALVTQLDVTGLATIGIYAVAAVHGCVYDGPTYKDEKEALRAALAMPREATPVAWVMPGDDNASPHGWIDARAWREGEFTIPLVRAPGAS